MATNRFIGGYTSSILISGIVHAIPFTLMTISDDHPSSISATPLTIEVDWQQSSALQLPLQPPKRSAVANSKESESPPSNNPPKRQTDIQLSSSSSTPFTPVEKGENLTFTNHKPLYPEEARLLGIEGTVMLKFTLCPDGKIQDVQALDPRAHPILEQAALEQVKGWRFHASPSNHSITVPIKFELEE
ncbi:energy transducer TonB [Candidatus Odyssella acanthamoebae]|uniref:Protein TonB n=1 Tax=Candidatus Odyssella acanthamoebae TaxID=91604 RepID=A0A077AZN8_9PROT|nr:energy transducer TonB [Candidatus Paracaedibacter acanthamoebae]AIK96195.1 hypothetical protein ID47_04705 [Candidatus Paracaedibacter acanthamoebae]